MKSILDRSFVYTASFETDVRKTFARYRREQRKLEQVQMMADAETRNVVAITARRREAPI